MKQKLLYRAKSWFLKIFGDIRIFKWPFFVIYQPRGYNIKGKNILEMERKLWDGDIILRGYDSFLDGFFIPIGKSKCSHSGIYFKGEVYHSIAEGVQKDTLIDFCQADRIIVLTPKKPYTKSDLLGIQKRCKQSLGAPYDFDFATHDTDNHIDGAEYNHLKFFCHEFTQFCIPKSIGIEKIIVENKLGMKNKTPTYLADSFFTNKNLKVIYKR